MDGKGLGMNEEGSVDFVRVKKNRENNGECHVIFSLWKRFRNYLWRDFYEAIVQAVRGRKFYFVYNGVEDRGENKYCVPGCGVVV